ncbi:hypothetical protein Y1Q_0019233 [Alligator mississippiensis]|uniref:Uncharacterized protein n=1 Tax=Alligator mississippiensis TaxID=8496 RepID=A0A151MQM1_ALLMI|nr:hypothetical protein Y1Q_0019233 [Alligator mississippiensis]
MASTRVSNNRRDRKIEVRCSRPPSRLVAELTIEASFPEFSSTSPAIKLSPQLNISVKQNGKRPIYT